MNDDTDPITRRVAGALISRFGDSGVLLTTKEGRPVCIAPGDQADVLAHFDQQP